MKRTTIMLPEDLQAVAQERARKEGLSFGGIVREALETYLHGPPAPPGVTPEVERDPFFADRAVFEGKTPPDLARNHDRYLYDEER